MLPVRKTLRLHTVRTGIPETLQTCLSASSFREYHSDTPRHPPNTLQTSPGNSRYQQTTTDDNRRQQTPPDTLRYRQVLFEAVFYYTSQYFIWWDFGGMTIQGLNIGGIDPNCLHPKPRSTTPVNLFEISIVLHQKENLHISSQLFVVKMKVFQA